MEENKLTAGKSYPAVLIGVTLEYDEVRKVYVVKFTYRVYLSPTQTVEVEDTFNWWDCPNFKRNTLEKIHKVMSTYNLVLIPKDYRNEIVFANTCKWLIGTRVELSPYRYKGIRYRVVSTERNDIYRVDKLWECLLDDNVEDFEKQLKEDEDYRKSFSNCIKDLENGTPKEINEDLFSDIGDALVSVDDTPMTEPKKKKRHCKRKKKEV